MRLNKITAIVGLLVLTCCGRLTTDNGYRIKAGDRMPAFSVTMNDGRTVSDVTISSGPALLVFFNTGCSDCRKELNILQGFWNRYSTELEICLISRGESSESVSRYWKEHNYSMLYSAQDDRAVYEKFSSSGIPLVVYSEDGIVSKVWDDKHMFYGEF